MSTTDRQCPRCGTRFQPDQQVCPNCYTPYPADPYQTPSPYAPSGSSGAFDPTVRSDPQQLSGYDHDAATVSASPYASSNPYSSNNPYGSSDPYASNNENSTVPPAYPEQQGPVPPAQSGYPGQQGPVPSVYPGQQGAVGYQQNAPYPSYSQPGQQVPNPAPYSPYPYPAYPQKKPASAGKILLIIGSVFLGVIVVLCSVFYAIGKSFDSHPVADSSTPTAITTTPITTTPQATAGPISQGDVPTPTGQALFADDFTDNHNNWDLSHGDNYSIAINKGLTIHDSNGNEYLTENVPGSDQWTDFRVDLTYTPNLQGDSDLAGIIFRSQPISTDNQEGPKGYLLKIDNQGDYVIRKVTTPVSATNPKAVYTDLQTGETDTPLLLGDPVNVTLMVKGNAMTLYLNGKYMNTTTDSSSPFTTGNLELFVVGSSQGTSTDATFTHVDVYPAPDTLPSV